MAPLMLNSKPPLEICGTKTQITMENTFQRAISAGQSTKVARPSLFTKFSNWCAGQETYRLGWLGGILAIHGCVLTPITLFAVILSGTNFALYITTLVAMA